MGIPGFNVWFSKENKGAYVPLNSIQVDHVYVDLNSILHNAMRKTKTWEKFHKRLHSRLNSVLEATSPRKSMMLAVDGPAPLAKLITQRERRKKAGSKVEREAEQSGGNGNGAQLSGLAITPGTRFMADITLSLTAWSYMKLSTRRYGHLSIELSDATVQGEGEVKILGRLDRHWVGAAANDTHVIVGDDGDLVLMACASSAPNLYVANTSLSGEGSIAPNMPILSVDKLHALWATRVLGAPAGQQPGPEAVSGAKMDLTLCAVLSSGNDYLPGLSMGARLKLDTLWSHYRRVRCTEGAQAGQGGGHGHGICCLDPATRAPAINAASLAAMLKACGACGRQGAQGPHTTSADDGDENGNGDGDVDSALAKGLPSAPHYLQGLVWLLDMYAFGRCPDYRFTYDSPPPSAMALVAVCEELASSPQGPLVTLARYGGVPPPAQQPLLPVACAMALLPASCAPLLPAPARAILTSPDSPLASLYVECEECAALSTRQRAANLQNLAAKTRYDGVCANMEGARLAGDAELEAELARTAEAVLSEYEATKRALSQTDAAKRQHLKHAHPYTPFPIEELATVAAGLTHTGLEAEEVGMMSFGNPVVLTRSLTQGTPYSHPACILHPPRSPFQNATSRSQTPVAVLSIRELHTPTHTHTHAQAAHSGTQQQQQPQGALGAARAVLEPDLRWATALAKRYISAGESQPAAGAAANGARRSAFGGTGTGGARPISAPTFANTSVKQLLMRPRQLAQAPHAQQVRQQASHQNQSAHHSHSQGQRSAWGRPASAAPVVQAPATVVCSVQVTAAAAAMGAGSSAMAAAAMSYGNNTQIYEAPAGAPGCVYGPGPGSSGKGQDQKRQRQGGEQQQQQQQGGRGLAAPPHAPPPPQPPQLASSAPGLRPLPPPPPPPLPSSALLSAARTGGGGYVPPHLRPANPPHTPHTPPASTQGRTHAHHYTSTDTASHPRSGRDGRSGRTGNTHQLSPASQHQHSATQQQQQQQGGRGGGYGGHPARQAVQAPAQRARPVSGVPPPPKPQHIYWPSP